MAAAVQPQQSTEDVEAGRAQVVTRYRVWLPAGTDVDAQCRLEWAGLTLSVDGDPQPWRDLGARPHHIKLTAVIATG